MVFPHHLSTTGRLLTQTSYRCPGRTSPEGCSRYKNIGDSRPKTSTRRRLPDQASIGTVRYNAIPTQLAFPRAQNLFLPSLLLLQPCCWRALRRRCRLLLSCGAFRIEFSWQVVLKDEKINTSIEMEWAARPIPVYNLDLLSIKNF